MVLPLPVHEAAYGGTHFFLLSGTHRDDASLRTMIAICSGGKCNFKSATKNK
jgi:hypothetical protein